MNALFDNSIMWAYSPFQVFETTCKQRTTAPERRGFFTSVLPSMGGVSQLVRLATWLFTGFQHPAHPIRLKPSLVGLSKLKQETVMQANLTAREDRAIYRALRILDTKFKNDAVPLRNSTAVTDYLRLKLAGLEVEQFRILWLDTQYRLIADDLISSGTIDQTAVSKRVVVRQAIAHNAAAAIFAHNHPGGVPKPSAADKQLTSHLKKALSLVDIMVLDHIVVTETKTSSFVTLGLLKGESK